MILVALVAMAGPGVAAGLCAHGPLPVVSESLDDHTAPTLPHLPAPCETLGGKRLLPATPVLDSRLSEIDGATLSQWARGLADQPMRRAWRAVMEPPPPRTA